MKNKRPFIIVLSVAVLLLIPFIAMQFNDEVNWALSDFLVAGILLLGIGFLAELAFRKIRTTSLRNAVWFALLALLVLVWAELAVGIFGTPFSGQ